jgi:hypothetical protein
MFLMFLTENKIWNINTGVWHKKIPENLNFYKIKKIGAGVDDNLSIKLN